MIKLLVGKTPVEKKVIRVFKSSEHGTIVVCGSEYLDHDIWSISGTTATLVGVLCQALFKKVKKVKKLVVEPADYDYCDNDKFKNLVAELVDENVGGDYTARHAHEIA